MFASEGTIGSSEMSEMRLSAVAQAHGFDIPCRHLYVHQMKRENDSSITLKYFEHHFNVIARKALVHLIKSFCPIIAGNISRENEAMLSNIDLSSDQSIMRNVNYYAGTLHGDYSSWSPSEQDIINGNFHDWPMKQIHELAPFEPYKTLSASFILCPTTGYIVSILSTHHRLFDADSTIRLFMNWTAITRQLLLNEKMCIDATSANIHTDVETTSTRKFQIPYPLSFDKEPIFEMERQVQLGPNKVHQAFRATYQVDKDDEVDSLFPKKQPPPSKNTESSNDDINHERSTNERNQKDDEVFSTKHQVTSTDNNAAFHPSGYLSQFRLRFSKQAIIALKEEATQRLKKFIAEQKSLASSEIKLEFPNDEHVYLTSNDVLCAHLWQSCVRACLHVLTTSPTENKTLDNILQSVPSGSCFFPCNLRCKTLNPTIKESYVGNGLVLASAVFTPQ